ncbi:MAG: NAD(P)-dependent glycerol-3-phosphate dehydrogenase [Leptospiraceae bacterium]|nr:NAD(P)-dependent glycerol-3-phosphate dehydrogenase [Leptospiraceae bacterium]MDW8307609.1 NAD(P)H-dependent glycerol-3-phosphate dehydrogenase [Leptospiraceae bacterium]
MKVAVIGAGSFGTALGKLLAENRHDVYVWSHSLDTAQAIREKRENTIYLPGFPLPENLRVSHELGEVLYKSELVVFAVPTQVARSVIEQMCPQLPRSAIIVSASKGIERGTLCLLADIFVEILGTENKKRLFFLSGPSFAREVAMRFPTAVTIAGYSLEEIGVVQAAFHNEYFRVYASNDVIGVELGGALKNVIALAAGISDGLGLGHNSRAALITRGLAEIARLGQAMGAHPLTFMGLAGMGDLVLTCTGDLSRNRSVGLEIGRGKTLKEVMEHMRMVAEGVPTTESAYELARKKEVEMPITEAVYDILYRHESPREAMRKLMTRRLKQELG